MEHSNTHTHTNTCHPFDGTRDCVGTGDDRCVCVGCGGRETGRDERGGGWLGCQMKGEGVTNGDKCDVRHVRVRYTHG